MQYRHVYTDAKYIINSLLFCVAVYNNTWSDFQLQLIKQRWPHLLNLQCDHICKFFLPKLLKSGWTAPSCSRCCSCLKQVRQSKGIQPDLVKKCTKPGHTVYLSAKDDCIFLTQEYWLKEFSVILQHQFTYYFNVIIKANSMQYRHVYTDAKYIINSLLFYVAVYNNTDRWLHLLNPSAVDDCIILTEEYWLKELSVILQQQFTYYFNARIKANSMQYRMYILMPNILLDLGCCI